MRRLLMLAYFFPPVGGAGSQRPAKFARYLPKFGWDVTVVAPEESSSASRWAPADESLCVDIENTRIERVAQNDSYSSWKRVFRGRAGWESSATGRVCELLDCESFDAVLITMSPFTLSHVAIELKRRYEIPVIVDLRDPWAFDGWTVYRHWFEWRRDLAMLRRVVRTVDGVVANTPESLRVIRSELPNVVDSNWVAIPNGYDHDDFRSLPLNETDRDIITIAHTGHLHSKWLYPPAGIGSSLKQLVKYRHEPILPEGRTLRYLLMALRHLQEQGHSLSHRVKICCYGSCDDATQKCVQELGAEKNVVLFGYVPHSESVAGVLAADALFLPLHAYKNRRQRSLIVPGKAYEYLASGKPILGCLPEGDARDLVANSGRGYLAYPNDVAEIADALQRLLEDLEAGRLPDAKPQEWVASYERQELSRSLGKFLDRIVK